MNLATENAVRTLVANGQGILAADETPGTGTPLPHVLASRASGPSTTPIGVSRGPLPVKVPVRSPYGGART